MSRLPQCLRTHPCSGGTSHNLAVPKDNDQEVQQTHSAGACVTLYLLGQKAPLGPFFLGPHSGGPAAHTL